MVRYVLALLLGCAPIDMSADGLAPRLGQDEAISTAGIDENNGISKSIRKEILNPPEVLLRPFTRWGPRFARGPRGFTINSSDDRFAREWGVWVSGPGVELARTFDGERSRVYAQIEFNDVLTPEATYRVQLLSSDGLDGGQRVPMWETTFTTPPMAMLGATRQYKPQDRVERRLAVTLHYAYPVDLEEVRVRTRFSVEHAPVEPSRFTLGPDGTSVFAVFHDLPRLSQAEGSLDVYTGPGLPAVHAPQYVSAAASYSVPLRADWATERVDDIDVALEPVPGGWVIDVSCRDPSAPVQYGSMGEAWSERCLLDALSVRDLRVSQGRVEHVGPGPRGFRIFGTFEPGPLELTIPDGSKTVDGGLFHRGFHGELQVDEDRPDWSLRRVQGAAGVDVSHVVVETLRSERVYSTPFYDDDNQIGIPGVPARRLSRESIQTVRVVDGQFSAEIAQSDGAAGTVVRVAWGEQTVEVVIEADDDGTEPIAIALNP